MSDVFVTRCLGHSEHTFGAVSDALGSASQPCWAVRRLRGVPWCDTVGPDASESWTAAPRTSLRVPKAPPGTGEVFHAQTMLPTLVLNRGQKEH